MSEDLPEVVYHYTSLDTMIKIAKSQSIWATSICYLNDVTENECFLGMLKRLLPDFLRRNRVSSVHEQALNVLKENVIGRFEDRPFIASFSQHDDLLPQWRSYCRNGDGVAIGFRVGCLRGAMLKEASLRPTFRQVEYLNADKEENADDVFKDLLKAIDLLGGPFDDSKSADAAEWCRLTAMGNACFYKDESFRSEDEFRLVLDGVHKGLELLQYRPVRSTLVPYVELTMPHRQFIDHVVVGPTPNMELTCGAVDSFFRSSGLVVNVEPTHVPFREW